MDKCLGPHFMSLCGDCDPSSDPVRIDRDIDLLIHENGVIVRGCHRNDVGARFSDRLERGQQALLSGVDEDRLHVGIVG